MRGPGQIAELCAIAAPDVAVVTNVGPVHVELVGSVEAIAAAKAEIIDGLLQGGTAVVPADPGPLAPHLERGAEAAPVRKGRRRRGDLGAGGGGRDRRTRSDPRGGARLQAALRRGTTSTTPSRRSPRASGSAIRWRRWRSGRRGCLLAPSWELIELPEDAILINDSYNANPISMRAALDHLASLKAGGGASPSSGDAGARSGVRRVPPRDRGLRAHEGRRAPDRSRGAGIQYGPDEQVADAEAAADALADALGPGDAVLVKGSRAVGPRAGRREADGAIDARARS